MLVHGHLVPEADLGRLARQARVEAGLTQEQAAERLGVSQSAIGHAEGEHHRGSLARLQRSMISELADFEADGPFYLVRRKGEKVTPDDLYV